MFNFIIPTSVVFYSISECISIKYAGLFAAIGFVVTINAALYKNSKQKLFNSNDEIFDASFLLIVSGILGARAFYVVTHADKFTKISEWFLFFDGGLSLMGALFASITCLSVYCKIRYNKILTYLDFCAPFGALLQVFMRMGCLFCGCCYGAAQATQWLPTVIYTNPGSMAPTGIILMASQLYSAVASVAIFAFLSIIESKQKNQPGLVFGLYCILEGLSRLVTDFTRGGREIVFSNLTWAQISAMMLCALGIAILTIMRGGKSESISTNKKQN